MHWGVREQGEASKVLKFSILEDKMSHGGWGQKSAKNCHCLKAS